MKLKIEKTAIIGDPEIGGEVEIKTNGRTYDIEVVKEKMPFNIPYDEEEFEKFSHALLVDKNAEWLGGYLFNIKNIVSIKK